MGLADAIERLKNLVNSKPSKSRSDSTSTTRSNTSYVPTSFYNMNRGDDSSYVDVECIATDEFIRVSGVNFNMQCSDFLLQLCSLLGLKATDYTFLVPSDSRSGARGVCWLCAAPSSTLGSYINPVTTQGNLPPMVRLMAKCCFKRSAKLYQYPFLDRKFKYPITPIKTGKEFLDELGHRIIVHLPGNRMVVVRGQLDQPINKVLQKVSTEFRIDLNNYSITNPKTGTVLDPKGTFSRQNAEQIELKERGKGKSSKNSKSAGNVQADDYPRSNSEMEYKKGPAPSIPGQPQIIHRHLSPFADVPDKIRPSSYATLPTQKGDFKRLDGKRQSAVEPQTNKHSVDICYSHELLNSKQSVTSIVKDKGDIQKRKSSTMVSSNGKKESERRGHSIAAPPPPPPATLFDSTTDNDNMLKSTHKNSRKSELLSQKKSSCSDDESFQEDRKSNRLSTAKNHSQEIRCKTPTKVNPTKKKDSQKRSHSPPPPPPTSTYQKSTSNTPRIPPPPPPPPLPSYSAVRAYSVDSADKDSRKSDSFLLRMNSCTNGERDSTATAVKKLNFKNNLQTPSVEMLTELTNALNSLRKTTNNNDTEHIDFSKKLPVNRGKISSAIRKNSSDNAHVQKNISSDKSNTMMQSVMESDDAYSMDTLSSLSSAVSQT